MPYLNHTGPEDEGPKTGRNFGICHVTDDEQVLAGELGKGLGKRRLSEGGKGKGKRLRLRYNQ